MYWLLMHKDDDGKYWLYVCKADTFDVACRIAGLVATDVSHCTLTKETFNHLSNVEAGYIRLEF